MSQYSGESLIVWIILVGLSVVGIAMIVMSRNISEFLIKTQERFFGKQYRLIEEKFGVRFATRSALGVRVMAIFLGAMLLFTGSAILYFLVKARASG